MKAKAAKKSAKVRWKAPADTGTAPITRYDVMVFLGKKKVATVSSRKTTATVKKLKPRKKYTFRVVAISSAGKSPMSASSKSVKPTARPVLPVDPRRPMNFHALEWIFRPD